MNFRINKLSFLHGFPMSVTGKQKCSCPSDFLNFLKISEFFGIFRNFSEFFQIFPKFSEILFPLSSGGQEMVKWRARNNISCPTHGQVTGKKCYFLPATWPSMKIPCHVSGKKYYFLPATWPSMRITRHVSGKKYYFLPDTWHIVLMKTHIGMPLPHGRSGKE